MKLSAPKEMQMLRMTLQKVPKSLNEADTKAHVNDPFRNRAKCAVLPVIQEKACNLQLEVC